MAGKFYDAEFKRRAVELYEQTPGATIQQIAMDLGGVKASKQRGASRRLRVG